MKIVTRSLEIGDIIVWEKSNVTVRSLELCSRKGAVKYHVNSGYCFDTLIPFTVHRSIRKEDRA